MQSTQVTQFLRRISRERSQKSLSMIIEYFDPTEPRNLGTKRYRVPLHQRFPSWPLDLKQKLVNTILQDFPLGSVIVTLHFETGGGHYFNVQDGQTRLTVLHEFVNNKFPAEDGRYFKDFTPDECARFMNYQISWEVIEKAEATDREFEEIIAEMFERLNSGKPLSDNDKFYARMSTPVMQFVMSLKKSPEFGMLLKKYCWPDLGSGKTRTGLKEVAGIVMPLILNCTDCITTSYKTNGKLMVSTDPTPEDLERVNTFLRLFFRIIELAIPNVAKPNRAIFNKIPSILGMMLCSWIQAGGDLDDEMWIKFIKAAHDHKHFIRTLFAKVDDFDRRCATTSAFNAKITAAVEAFSQTRSFDHIIAEITGPTTTTHGGATTNSMAAAALNRVYDDSGSETETDNEDSEDYEEESDD